MALVKVSHFLGFKLEVSKVNHVQPINYFFSGSFYATFNISLNYSINLNPSCFVLTIYKLKVSSIICCIKVHKSSEKTTRFCENSTVDLNVTT